MHAHTHTQARIPTHTCTHQHKRASTHAQAHARAHTRTTLLCSPIPFYDSELQLFRAHDAPPFTLTYPDGRTFDHAGGAQPAERVNLAMERAMTLNKCKVRVGDVQWRSTGGDAPVDHGGAFAGGGARVGRVTLLPVTLHAARTRFERALERMDAASRAAKEVQRAVASLYEPHTRAEFDATLMRLAELTRSCLL